MVDSLVPRARNPFVARTLLRISPPLWEPPRRPGTSWGISPFHSVFARDEFYRSRSAVLKPTNAVFCGPDFPLRAGECYTTCSVDKVK